MAKGYKKPIIDKKSVLKSPRVREWTSTKGKTVHLTGIDPLIIDVIRASVSWPEEPTYEINTELVKGEVHTLTWDVANEEAAEGDPELAVEYKRQLDEYTRLLKTANTEFNTKLTKAVFDGGVIFIDETDDEWADMQEFLGIGASKNKKQRKYDRVVSTVIGCDEDLYDILQIVMEMTGVPRDALAEARDSFRGNAETSRQADSAGETES